jgi:hypothetical protein
MTADERYQDEIERNLDRCSDEIRRLQSVNACLLAACQAAGDGIYYGFDSEHQKRHVLDQLRTAIEKAEPQK